MQYCKAISQGGYYNTNQPNSKHFPQPKCTQICVYSHPIHSHTNTLYTLTQKRISCSKKGSDTLLCLTQLVPNFAFVVMALAGFGCPLQQSRHTLPFYVWAMMSCDCGQEPTFFLLVVCQICSRDIASYSKLLGQVQRCTQDFRVLVAIASIANNLCDSCVCTAYRSTSIAHFSIRFPGTHGVRIIPYKTEPIPCNEHPALATPGHPQHGSHYTPMLSCT